MRPLMREAAASADYRAIFFNNGLHSLHWTPEKTTDEQIERQTRAIVRGFREGAPQARLFWLATTPHCDRPPASRRDCFLGDFCFPEDQQGRGIPLVWGVFLGMLCEISAILLEENLAFLR
jgi:hypothetical protein